MCVHLLFFFLSVRPETLDKATIIYSINNGLNESRDTTYQDVHTFQSMHIIQWRNVYFVANGFIEKTEMNYRFIIWREQMLF